MVIPVRVGREGQLLPLPRPDDLPADIRDLVLYQKHDVAHERFGRDIADLIEAITLARRSKRAQPAVTRVPWGWIGTTAGVLAITYVGARYAGVPVPWPGSPAAVASLDGGTGQRLDFSVRLNGSGVVQAWSTVDIRTRIDGQIEKIAFEEGQMVKKGDLLLQIDPRPFQAALDQALSKKALDEAQLANSKFNLTRYKTLGNNFVSQQQIDTQGALVNQQEAQIKADQGVMTLGYRRASGDRSSPSQPPAESAALPSLSTGRMRRVLISTS